MKNTIFILWPLPTWLFAAKRVLEEQQKSINDCEVIPAGKNLILEKLINIKKELTKKDIKIINILVPHVVKEESEQLKKTLNELTKGGRTRIHWFTSAGEKNISNICNDISGVTCHFDNHAKARQNDISTDLEASPKSGKPFTQEDFLRYKITRAFLGDANGRFDSNQLAEGIGDLFLTKKEFVQKHRNSLANYTKSYPAIEGRSPLITALKKEIHRLAKADNISVLLSGETGTGKEAVAFFLHDLSSRREKPYGAVNCAGFHEELLHSTLFGHKKGAFTGATSNNPGLLKSLEGGTVFLDELPDMPIKVQAMFLRFLEDGTFIPLGGTHADEQYADIRVIGAAQPDLLKYKFGNNQFRKDLYFRIAEKKLTIPPLRELKDDLLLLVTHLSYKIGRDNQYNRYGTIRFFTAHADYFMRHEWPGNVRELAGYVKRRLQLGQNEEKSILKDIDKNEGLFRSASGIVAEENKGSEVLPDAPVSFGRIDEASNIYTHKQIIKKYINHVYDQLSKRGLSKAKICRKLGIANQQTLNNHLGSAANCSPTPEPIIIGKAGEPVAVLSASNKDLSPSQLGGSWKSKVKI